MTSHGVREVTSAIAISRVHFPITALGPGRRIGIWFQGCSIRCSGCISADTWIHSRETIQLDQLFETIEVYSGQADGVTITGGEPFDQAEALGELLVGLKARISSDADVLVYSGYPYAAIEGHVSQWKGLIDALISEPFNASETQTRALMGSDNQKLHLLTALGALRFQSYDRMRNGDDDRLDFMMDLDGTAWLAGIPKLGDLERLRVSLGALGTHIRTSEHRSPLL